MPEVESTQQELAKKLAEGEKVLGKKQEGAESYLYYQMAFINKVDQFQQLADDKALSLSTLPAAKAHYDQGQTEVEAILKRACIAGSGLLLSAEKGETTTQARQSAAENLNSMAEGLISFMSPYKDRLKEIGEVEKVRTEASKALDYAKEPFKNEMAQLLNLPSEYFAKVEDGAVKCGEGRDMLDTGQKLPEPFRTEQIEFFDNALEHFKRVIGYKAVYDRIGEKKWPHVEISINLRTGEPKVTLADEFKNLPQEKQDEILKDLAVAKLRAEQQVEVAASPKIMANYYIGLALFEQGNMEEAAVKLKQFTEKDVWSPEMQAHPEYWAKNEEFANKGKELLALIDKQLKGNVDFYEGQKLAQSGNLIEAKNRLKKFLSEHGNEKPSADQSIDYPKAAKGLLKQIAQVQLEELRAKVADFPEPQYFDSATYGGADVDKLESPQHQRWADMRAKLSQLEKLFAGGEVLDLSEFIEKNFPNLEQGSPLRDVIVEEKEGREGLLKLARKYRAMGRTELARRYFAMYFKERMSKKAQEVTLDKLEKKYHSNPTFHSEITKKEQAVIDEYKTRFGDQWEEQFKKHEKETGMTVRKEIETRAFQEILPKEVMQAQQENTAEIPPAELDAWNEFSQMEGIKPRTIAGVETFAIRDEEIAPLIANIVIAVAITAASAGVASAGAAVVSRGVVMLGARLGLGAGTTTLLAGATGFAAESALFSLSSVTLNAIKDGRFSLNNIGEDFRNEIWSGTAVLGAFKMIGVIGKGFAAGSRLAEAAERGSMAAKMAVGARGIADQMVGMAIVEGDLNVNNAAMVLGLALAHSKTAERITQKQTRAKEAQLEQMRLRDRANRERILNPGNQPASAPAAGPAQGPYRTKAEVPPPTPEAPGERAVKNAEDHAAAKRKESNAEPENILKQLEAQQAEAASKAVRAKAENSPTLAEEVARARELQKKIAERKEYEKNHVQVEIGGEKIWARKVENMLQEYGPALATAETYRKKGTVGARQATDRELIATTQDGTQNYADPGDWIIHNPGDAAPYVFGNKTDPVEVRQQKFAGKYEPIEGQSGQYRAKGLIKAVQVGETITFPTSWGENMTVKAGGWVADGGYGIAAESFANTYERYNPAAESAAREGAASPGHGAETAKPVEALPVPKNEAPIAGSKTVESETSNPKVTEAQSARDEAAKKAKTAQEALEETAKQVKAARESGSPDPALENILTERREQANKAREEAKKAADESDMAKSVEDLLKKAPGSDPKLIESLVREFPEFSLPEMRAKTPAELQKIIKAAGEAKQIRSEIRDIPPADIQKFINEYNRSSSGDGLKSQEFRVLRSTEEGVVVVDQNGKLQFLEVNEKNSKEVLSSIKEQDNKIRGPSYELRSELLRRSKGGISTAEAYTHGEMPGNWNQQVEFLMNPENWLAQRRKVHEEMVRSETDRALKLSEQMNEPVPTFYMLRGNTAAGKTTSLKKNDTFKHAVDREGINGAKEEVNGAINPDIMKAMLRNRELNAEGKHTINPFQAHMEGRLLSYQIRDRAMAENPKVSLIFDERFSWEPSLTAAIDAARANQKRVRILDVDSPLESSCQKVLLREPAGTDPVLVFSVVAEGYGEIRQNRQVLIDRVLAADSVIADYVLYMTDKNGKTHMLIEKTNGKVVKKPTTPEELALFYEARNSDVKPEINNVANTVIDDAYINRAPERSRPGLKKYRRIPPITLGEALNEHGRKMGNEPALDPKAVSGVLESSSFEPQNLIDILKTAPELATLFASVDKIDGEPVETRTGRAMSQFEKYFAGKELPPGTDASFFRLLLAFHDISKPANAGATPANAPIINETLKRFGYGKEQVTLMLTLMEGNPLGDILNKRLKPQEGALEIEKMAKKANMPVEQFYRILETFYMADASSLASDAGGKGSTDKLFSFDSKKKSMDFSKKAQETVAQLKEQLARIQKARDMGLVSETEIDEYVKNHPEEITTLADEIARMDGPARERRIQEIVGLDRVKAMALVSRLNSLLGKSAYGTERESNLSNIERYRKDEPSLQSALSRIEEIRKVKNKDEQYSLMTLLYNENPALYVASMERLTYDLAPEISRQHRDAKIGLILKGYETAADLAALNKLQSRIEAELVPGLLDTHCNSLNALFGMVEEAGVDTPHERRRNGREVKGTGGDDLKLAGSLSVFTYLGSFWEVPGKDALVTVDRDFIEARGPNESYYTSEDFVLKPTTDLNPDKEAKRMSFDEKLNDVMKREDMKRYLSFMIADNVFREGKRKGVPTDQIPMLDLTNGFTAYLRANSDISNLPSSKLGGRPEGHLKYEVPLDRMTIRVPKERVADLLKEVQKQRAVYEAQLNGQTPEQALDAIKRRDYYKMVAIEARFNEALGINPEMSMRDLLLLHIDRTITEMEKTLRSDPNNELAKRVIERLRRMDPGRITEYGKGGLESNRDYKRKEYIESVLGIGMSDQVAMDNYRKVDVVRAGNRDYVYSENPDYLDLFADYAAGRGIDRKNIKKEGNALVISGAGGSNIPQMTRDYLLRYEADSRDRKAQEARKSKEQPVINSAKIPEIVNILRGTNLDKKAVNDVKQLVIYKGLPALPEIRLKYNLDDATISALQRLIEQNPASANVARNAA